MIDISASLSYNLKRFGIIWLENGREVFCRGADPWVEKRTLCLVPLAAPLNLQGISCRERQQFFFNFVGVVGVSTSVEDVDQA
jgi:hypothetical protein